MGWWNFGAPPAIHSSVHADFHSVVDATEAILQAGKGDTVLVDSQSCPHAEATVRSRCLISLAMTLAASGQVQVVARKTRTGNDSAAKIDQLAQGSLLQGCGLD